jgi:DNA-binding NtrC family response regulator
MTKASRGGAIVCIDDDPDVLAAVARILRPLEREVLTTIEPRQALDWIALRDIAVLVSDYEMPEMNGVELASSARAIRPETVRVLLTGRRTLETAIDGINRGEVFRYVTKPFEALGLRDTVRAALDRHGELAASAQLREQSVRRERLTAALEAEHPSLTQVARDPDGAYRVPAIPAEAARGLGLDALLAIGIP